MYCWAQTSGNINYGRSGVRGKPELHERTAPLLTKEEQPPGTTSMYVESSVLMNVKADEYVAVLASCTKPRPWPECSQKMANRSSRVYRELKTGVGDDDVVVDFVAQNRDLWLRVQGGRS